MNDGMFDRFRRGRPVGMPQSGDTTPVTAGPALQRRDAGGGSSGNRALVTDAEIDAAVERVPALPTVVGEILKLCGSAGANAHDLERQVGQDLVISGRLLKLVNSAFYGLPNPISSLQQAVAIVGFGSMRSLVLAASAAGMLQVGSDGYGFTEAGLWKNAAVTASMAKGIALEAGLEPEEADEYFLAGLLRDIGMLVLGPFLDRFTIRLRRDAGGEADLLKRERAAIGHDHCKVGGMIADRWKLPRRITDVIVNHHRIPKDLPQAELRLLAAVRLAERLANKAGVGLTKEHALETLVDPVLLQSTGLDGDGLRAVIAEIPAMVAEAETFRA